MKILLLTTPFTPNVGGVETHLNDLIKEGQKKGINFRVITYQPLVTKARGKSVEKKGGAVIYRVPWLRMNLFLHLEKYPVFEFLYLFLGIFAFSLIYMIIKSSEIGTIHSQGLAAGVVGLILSKLFNKRLIISTHSIYHFPTGGIYTAFVRFLFNNSYHVLTLSKQSEEELKKIGVNEKKISVFTYWVDQEKFKVNNPLRGQSSKFNPFGKLRVDAERSRSIKIRKKLGLENKFICLFVGRLVPKKGIEELLEAAKITSERVKFLIVGDGPLEESIKYQVSSIKNLIFLGKVDNEKLPIYYNAADVLIVPSTHEEGFGRVILEALSCGLPVIGSNRGAIPEAMNDNVGVFIDVTPENIKIIVEKLSENPEILMTMRKKARKFAEKNYSSKNLEMITRYYET